MDVVWSIFGILALISILCMSVKSSALDMRGMLAPKRFAELGTLTGKAKAEIIKAVGEPTHIDYHMPGGKVLLQWIFPKYHVALLFDGEICEGVTHESESK